MHLQDTTPPRCHPCAHCETPVGRKRNRYCSLQCAGAHRQATRLAMFWTYVDQTGECWLWTGSRNHDGYGLFKHPPRGVCAHRYAWELAHGVAPGKRHVLHSCDNPPCVRPSHLFLGDHAINMADMGRKGRTGSHAKLTDEQVRAIRARYARGDISQTQLAAEYGMHQSTFSRFLRHQTRTAAA